jgi:hypothetical protein
MSRIGRDLILASPVTFGLADLNEQWAQLTHG